MKKRSKKLLLLAAGCVAAVRHMALAAEAVIITDAGIYTFAKSVDHANAATTSGIVEAPVDEPRLLQHTTHVCAKLHTHFGLHIGLPVAGRTLPVEIVFTHPPMTNQSGQMQRQDVINSKIASGRLHYIGWSFEDPTKLLPGRWHISVLHHGQMIADQGLDIDFSCIQAIS